MLRIRGRTLRDESLETNTARDLIQVVRMFVEMDVGPVSPSSTSQDARHRAQKWNVGPERRKGLGTSRADVSGNARHFCDGEFNFTGCEGERSGLNHWTDMTQRSWNKSCGHIRKWTSVL